MTTIESVRSALHLTQAQFAARIGVSSRTVIRWERDAHKPLPAIQRLIDELALSLVRDAIKHLDQAESESSPVQNARAQRRGLKPAGPVTTETDTIRYGPMED